MRDGVQTIDPPAEYVVGSGDEASVLATLVSSFSASPVANGRRMRDLLHLNPHAFRAGTVSALHRSTDERGYRYLVTLLSSNDLLVPLLSDAALPLPFAITLAATAVKVDPQLHLRLIRTLVDSMLEAKDLPEETACRLLGLLGSITEIAGLQHFLKQMLFHPSARIRSKVGLLIGRGPAGARAIETLLSDENERVRANAAEALWDWEEPHLTQVFSRLLTDPNHRVVGNAIIGLYLRGDLRSTDAIQRLNSHPDPLFRAAGIWAMGRSKDPRYRPQLARMLAESSGPGRTSVFNAINFIRKAAVERAINPPFEVTVLKVLEGDSGAVTVDLVVPGQNVSEPPHIPATGFSIMADDLAARTIECVEKRNDSAALCLVLPRHTPGSDPFDAGLEKEVLAFVDFKPKREPWAIAYYAPSMRVEAKATKPFGADPSDPPPAVTGPSFTISSDVLRGSLANRTAQLSTGQDWLEAVFAALSGQIPARDSRHLITFVDSTSGVDAAGIQLLSELAEQSRFRIHVLCRHPDERISNLCATTGGYCHTVESVETLKSRLQLVYATIRNSFSVTFARPGDMTGMPKKIGIQVFNDSQTGQAEWRNPTAV